MFVSNNGRKYALFGIKYIVCFCKLAIESMSLTVKYGKYWFLMYIYSTDIQLKTINE